MSFSTLGRLISVSARILTCCSVFGCTASPTINGLRTDSVSTNTLAVASYCAGMKRAIGRPTTATSQATRKPPEAPQPYAAKVLE